MPPHPELFVVRIPTLQGLFWLHRRPLWARQPFYPSTFHSSLSYFVSFLLFVLSRRLRPFICLSSTLGILNYVVIRHAQLTHRDAMRLVN